MYVYGYNKALCGKWDEDIHIYRNDAGSDGRVLIYGDSTSKPDIVINSDGIGFLPTDNFYTTFKGHVHQSSSQMQIKGGGKLNISSGGDISVSGDDISITPVRGVLNLGSSQTNDIKFGISKISKLGGYTPWSGNVECADGYTRRVISGIIVE